MVTDTPLIKNFRTTKKYYIYDTWTNEILNVHKNFWNYLEKNESTQNQNRFNKLIENEVIKAKNQGYLSTDRPEIELYYTKKNWEQQILNEINHNLEQLSLNITEQCNFRCEYCLFSEDYNIPRNHSNKNMSWIVAKKSIEYAIKHHKPDKKVPLAISFYGGEPLCNFKLIEKSVHYCLQEYPGFKIQFSLSTNGSLINEKIANFLVKNNFNILFSLDGPQHLHDRYRKTKNGNSTYNSVLNGLNLLRKWDVKKKLKITINCLLSPPFDLPSVNRFVNSVTNERIKITLTSGEYTNFYNRFDRKKEFHNYKLQSEEIFNRFKNSLKISPRENADKMGLCLFEKELLPIATRKMNRMEHKVPAKGQCIPGVRKIFVSSDGLFYPCEKTVGEYCIGDIENGINFSVVYKLLKDWVNLFRYVCNDCWAVRLCSKCFVGFDPSGNFKKTNIEQFCDLKRKIIEDNLTKYCSIQELNPQSFDYVKNIYLPS